MGAGATNSHTGQEVTLIDAAGPLVLAYQSGLVIAPTTSAFGTLHTHANYADTVGTDDAPNVPVSNASLGRMIFQRQPGRFQQMRLFYTGADNCQSDHRLWGIMQIVLGKLIQYSWVEIGTFTGTAGTKTGVAGGILTTSHRYVDTFTAIVDGGYNLTELKRPTVDEGSIALRWEAREFSWFALEGSTNAPGTKATGFNALIRGLNGGGN